MVNNNESFFRLIRPVFLRNTAMVYLKRNLWEVMMVFVVIFFLFWMVRIIRYCIIRVVGQYEFSWYQCNNYCLVFQHSYMNGSIWVNGSQLSIKGSSLFVRFFCKRWPHSYYFSQKVFSSMTCHWAFSEEVGFKKHNELWNVLITPYLSLFFLFGPIMCRDKEKTLFRTETLEEDN